MEEISATSEHNEKNTREADRLAEAASRSAQHGGEEMRANIDLMEKGYTDLMVDGAPSPHQSDTTLRWLIDRLRS